MTAASPRISVIVPSYNHARFVRRCIESIINQTCKDYELIVIDDGSTDDSRLILEDLKKQHGFTLILQENAGVARTLNRAIREHAKGKYISVCASDDYYLPHKLETQLAYMERHPDVPMCYGKVYVVDEDDNVVEKLTVHRNKNLKGGEIFPDILLQKFHLPVTYFIRKSIFEEVGYYREDIITEDFYMNLSISVNRHIGYIDDFLLCYRTFHDYHHKLLTTRSAMSHLECINRFRTSEYYAEAINRWHYRNVLWYSPYKQHKLFVAKNILRSLRYMGAQGYIKSLIKFFLVWR